MLVEAISKYIYWDYGQKTDGFHSIRLLPMVKEVKSNREKFSMLYGHWSWYVEQEVLVFSWKKVIAIGDSKLISVGSAAFYLNCFLY